MTANEEHPNPDTFRILVTTDNHVGHKETDKIRGDDAMNTFEEILQIAKAQKADLILDGGDLFDENKPSRRTLYGTMDLLRRYCMGPGAVRFRVVSNPKSSFRTPVNYEDPNLNIETPFFMIHGNHDDPGGEGNLSAADLLAAAGLVNYFGRVEDVDDIQIRPVLLQKGATRLALYGLGNVRDERLHRAFTNRKVDFATPADVGAWFNVMLVHQNRYKGGSGGGLMTKNCIHEQMLPQFLDVVLWGHEHDCLVDPQESARREFHVIQPGSSVATSLSNGETLPKHVALLEVCGDNFRCTPIPLRSVRPFSMGEVTLSEAGLVASDERAVWGLLTEKVEGLIADAAQIAARDEAREKERRAREGDDGVTVRPPRTPLVRLRVEHTGFPTLGNQRFGQQFVGRVANPEDILHFTKRRRPGTRQGDRELTRGDVLQIEDTGGFHEGTGEKIQDIVFQYLGQGQTLDILPEPDFNIAVQEFAQRNDVSAIERFVRDTAENFAQETVDSQALGGCAAAAAAHGRGAEDPGALRAAPGSLGAAIVEPQAAADEVRALARMRTEKVRQMRLEAASASIPTTAAAPQAPAGPAGGLPGGPAAGSSSSSGSGSGGAPAFGGGGASGASSAAPAAFEVVPPEGAGASPKEEPDGEDVEEDIEDMELVAAAGGAGPSAAAAGWGAAASGGPCQAAGFQRMDTAGAARAPAPKRGAAAGKRRRRAGDPEAGEDLDGAMAGAPTPAKRGRPAGRGQGANGARGAAGHGVQGTAAALGFQAAPGESLLGGGGGAAAAMPPPQTPAGRMLRGDGAAAVAAVATPSAAFGQALSAPSPFVRRRRPGEPSETEQEDGTGRFGDAASSAGGLSVQAAPPTTTRRTWGLRRG